MYWVFIYQSMSCLLTISLKPKTNLILWNFAQTLWYFFEIIFQEYFLFFNWNPPNYFILSSYNRRVTVTKVTQKALNCQCLGKAKMSKTCYHAWALSESVAFVSQNSRYHLTEKLCDLQHMYLFSILNGIPGILVSICIYLCMSKKLNSYFSDVFCMASNFLNRYFVNVICICVYFFQDLSMVGIFFYVPAFYQI